MIIMSTAWSTSAKANLVKENIEQLILLPIQNECYKITRRVKQSAGRNPAWAKCIFIISRAQLPPVLLGHIALKYSLPEILIEYWLLTYWAIVIPNTHMPRNEQLCCFLNTKCSQPELLKHTYMHIHTIHGILPFWMNNIQVLYCTIYNLRHWNNLFIL